MLASLSLDCSRLLPQPAHLARSTLPLFLSAFLVYTPVTSVLPTTTSLAPYVAMDEDIKECPPVACAIAVSMVTRTRVVFASLLLKARVTG